MEGFFLKSKPIYGRNLTTHFTHHYEYLKDNIKLDLHWALQSPFSYDLDYDKIWITKETLIFNHKINGVLSEEYELVFRIASIFMDIQLGTSQYKSFVDLYLILEHSSSDFGWHELMLEREKEGLFPISINVLDLLLRYSKERIQKENDGIEKTIFEINKFPKGIWHDFIIFAKWSYKDDGIVNIWLNGNKIVNYNGPVGYNDELGPFTKFGIYRNDVPETYVIYFDVYRRGYSYEKVDPSNLNN